VRSVGCCGPFAVLWNAVFFLCFQGVENDRFKFYLGKEGVVDRVDGGSDEAEAKDKQEDSLEIKGADGVDEAHGAVESRQLEVELVLNVRERGGGGGTDKDW